MKKLICMICAGILIVILVGCSSQTVNTSVIKTDNNDINNIVSNNSSSDYGTTRELLEVTSKNTKVYYPKLQGYKGELSMGYMNQSIKQIAESYGKSVDYTDVQLDYEVKRVDEEIVSVLFKGTGKFKNSRRVNIQKSINLDVKSTNPIIYENFIKNDERSRAEVIKLLDTKAINSGIAEGFEAERVFIYFEEDNAVFFYMPLDDNAKDWVEISLPLVELDGLINTEFGEYPAS